MRKGHGWRRGAHHVKLATVIILAALPSLLAASEVLNPTLAFIVGDGLPPFEIEFGEQVVDDEQLRQLALAYATRHKLDHGGACVADVGCVAETIATTITSAASTPILWSMPDASHRLRGDYDISFDPLSSPLDAARDYVVRYQREFDGSLPIFESLEVTTCDERCVVMSMAQMLERARRKRGFHSRAGGGGSSTCDLLASSEEAIARLPFWNETASRADGEPAFVPRGRRELLASVYTMHNLLDRNMASEGIHEYSYGHIRPVQLVALLDLLESRNRGTTHHRGQGLFCEVGMNGGHSATAALVAGFDVVSFDLGGWPYTKSTERLLHLAYGDRFTLVLGDSRETIPQLRDSLRGRCDVIMVDGAHTHDGVLADLRNLRFAAAPGHAIMIDDTQSADMESTWSDTIGCWPHFGHNGSSLADDSVKRAVEAALDEGTLAALEMAEYVCGHPCNPSLVDPFRKGHKYQRWGYALAKFAVV